MKKVLLVLTLMCMVVAPKALALDWQEDQDGSQAIGVYVGYANPHGINSIKEGGDKDKSRLSLNGFQIGAQWEKNFVKGLGLVAGLNYTFGANSRGWKDKDGNYEYEKDDDVKNLYHALDIHVDLQYKFKIAKNMYIGAYTGPTLQAHLSLKEKQKADGETEKMDYFSKDDMGEDGQLKHANLTWGLGLVYQYKNYFLRAGYDWGIMSALKNGTIKEDDYKEKTRIDQFQIRLGMYLWQK